MLSTKPFSTVAALMEPEQRGDGLIAATRKLCGAFSDFLNAVNPDHREVRERVWLFALRPRMMNSNVIG